MGGYISDIYLIPSHGGNASYYDNACGDSCLHFEIVKGHAIFLFCNSTIHIYSGITYQASIKWRCRTNSANQQHDCRRADTAQEIIFLIKLQENTGKLCLQGDK